MSRRRFGVMTGGALAALAFGKTAVLAGVTSREREGRITARPRRGTVTSAESGPLGLGAARDAVLQLPPEPDGALPLLVLLHGAGGSGARILRRLGSSAADAGLAVLAPDSRSNTWDGINERFGPDVAFLDRALERVFDTVAIDAARVSIGGFSDGASYALTLALMNGDFFRSAIAFSPGFANPSETRGAPRFFVSHGRSDSILPISRCSRMIVRRLREARYTVVYKEFDGGHEVPPAIALEGMAFAARS